MQVAVELPIIVVIYFLYVLVVLVEGMNVSSCCWCSFYLYLSTVYFYIVYDIFTQLRWKDRDEEREGKREK